MKRQTDQQYRSKWISIQNFLKNNTGYSFAGVARAGSRKQGDWRIYSDLDIRFAISGDPSRNEIYPDLRDKLENAFPKAQVWIGSSYHVINMKIENLNFDLVLLSINDFQYQVEQERLERII